MWKAVIILTIITYAGILAIPAFMSADNATVENVIPIEEQIPSYDEYGYGDAIAQDEVAYLSQNELNKVTHVFRVISSPQIVLTVVLIFVTFLGVVGYLSAGFIITFWMMHA